MPPRRIHTFAARDLYALSDSARAKNHPFFADGLDFSGDRLEQILKLAHRLQAIADWMSEERARHNDVEPPWTDVICLKAVSAILFDVLNGVQIPDVDRLLVWYWDQLFQEAGFQLGVSPAFEKPTVEQPTGE
jgi:hypothetical protein